jgi:hypothetical protein
VPSRSLAAADRVISTIVSMGRRHRLVPVRARGSVAALLLSLTGGCAAHITGGPPRAPWHAATNRGRGVPAGLSPAAGEPYEAWIRDRAAIEQRLPECLAAARLERDRTAREHLERACVVEKEHGLQRAAEAYVRSLSERSHPSSTR